MTTLSPETRATVKATIPALQEHGVEIITKFYSILFEKYPTTKTYFNKDRVAPEASDNSGTPPQIAALAGAVVAYAEHIDDVSPIMPVVERICHVHVSRDVRGPHYPLVGKCLLEAIAAVLGPDVATAEVADAWGKAFQFLADALIATEKSIRENLAAAEGGFSGFKEFKIDSVTEHAADGAKTFTLVPTDSAEGAVPAHRGGQYLSFVLPDVPGVGKCKASAMLSDVSKKSLTFTVYPNGERAVTALLAMKEGDMLETSVPCGPFEIEAKAVEDLGAVAVAGKADDVGMLIAVSKDLRAAGVKDVTIVAENNSSFGDIGESLECEGVTFSSVDALSAKAVSKLGVEGLFVAPSVREVVDEIGNVAEGNTSITYTKVIE